MSAVYDFDKQLAASQADNVHALVRRVMFEKFAGELLDIIPSHEENDKRGADYILVFRNCKYENLDVKTRAKDYYQKPNTALEYRTGKKDGWTIDTDKLTDWVLFLWLDTERASLHNARMLRIVARDNQEEWMQTHQQSTQVSNGDYSSPCVYFTDHELWAAEYKHFSYEGHKKRMAGLN